MNFDEFRIKYADIMMFFQRIENDIKLIYAFMREGDVNEHYDEIENKTLGQMIRELRKLDNLDGNPYINSEDYNFLERICEDRNHWAHSTFRNFIYEKNCFKSKEYKKECAKLAKEYNEVKSASDILEKIRIEFCTAAR